jgi:hypothetical protein
MDDTNLISNYLGIMLLYETTRSTLALVLQLQNQLKYVWEIKDIHSVCDTQINPLSNYPPETYIDLSECHEFVTPTAILIMDFGTDYYIKSFTQSVPKLRQ